jgi:hypothetical protein
LALRAAVGNENAMRGFQFAQLIALSLEYRPDVILELGRGYGNSTCAFTEAANHMGDSKCRVISLCLTAAWEPAPPPAIAAVVPPEWFAPLKTHRCDLLDFDYESALEGAKRVLIFWDAHGFDVAECVLGKILPLIADRDHLVVMHDLSDGRILGRPQREYGDKRLWRGNDWGGQLVWLGNVVSNVEQAVAVIDFTTRNRVDLRSADESIGAELAGDQSKIAEMRELLGDELFFLRAHWFYFTLTGYKGPFTFPRFPTPQERGLAPPAQD